MTALRERKRQELRERLSGLAFELCVQRGFDNVRIADIAAAANVSEKTVFNHFSTKEELLLPGAESLERGLVVAVEQRHPSEPLLVAARRYIFNAAERMATLPYTRRKAFADLVQSTPSLRQRLRGMSLQVEDELTAVISKQTSASVDDPTPRVVAVALGTLLRLAYGTVGWPTSRKRSLEEILQGMESSLSQLERGLAGYGVTASVRKPSLGRTPP